MPITSLNKIINLFLIGILSLVMWWLLFDLGYSRLHGTPLLFQELLQNKELFGEKNAFLISALVLSITCLAGMINESLVDVVRKVIRGIGRDRMAKLLFVTRSSEKHNFWRDQFQKAMSDSHVFVSGHEAISMIDEMRGIAVALLFRSGKEGTLKWGLEHDALHLLMLHGFLILVQGMMASFLVHMSCGMHMASVLALGLAAVMLLREALSNQFYSYEIAFREGVLILLEQATARTRKNE